MARTGHSRSSSCPPLQANFLQADLLQQSEAAGLGDGRRSGRYVELGEGIGDVPVDGVLADEEPLRNRLIVEAGRNQPKNLDLSWRQALPVVGPGRRRLRAASSGHRAPRGRERAPDWRREASDRRWRAGPRRRRLPGRPSAPITRASSTRARPVSNGAPLSLNRSTASSRCFLADFGSPDRAATRPAARLANARSGPVRASLAMAWSSATAVRGFVRAALLQAGADHQLQRSRALRPILRRQTPEVALGEIRARS